MKEKQINLDVNSDTELRREKDHLQTPPKIGIFGGTFNPIHLGHLRLAEDVREEFLLDRVIFVPTNIPPHKKLNGNVTAADRMKMIEMSISGNNYFEVDDIEIRKGGVSYTIDTAKYLYENYDFFKKPYFILGSDQAISIKTWKKIDELAKLLSFVVLIRKEERTRIPEVENIMKNLNIESFFFTGREIDITSSEVRKRLQEGKSIRYLVRDEVLNYILENRLYIV